MIQPLRPSELGAAAQHFLSWLWQGYLAPGKVTALVSPPKSGKTTLVSHLLARLAQGGQLAGLAVTPGRAIVVSEESAGDWDIRCRQLALGPNVQFVCRPFKGARPIEAQWLALVANLAALHRQEPVELVVIDPLATLLPGYAEMCAPKMVDCLLPLQDLANQGPALWLVHHPAKGKRADGEQGRGSIALPGFVDILMEMNRLRRARSRDRRRRICGYARYLETSRHVIIELNADGTDYVVRTDRSGVPLVETWPAVQHILANTFYKRSLQQILDSWPIDEADAPERSTLSRWLKRACDQGVVCCSGTGYKGDGFLYWLPGREPLLYPGDNASEEEKEAWRERIGVGRLRPREQTVAPVMNPPAGAMNPQWM